MATFVLIFDVATDREMSHFPRALRPYHSGVIHRYSKSEIARERTYPMQLILDTSLRTSLLPLLEVTMGLLVRLALHHRHRRIEK